jgi:hypothetical protein
MNEKNKAKTRKISIGIPPSKYVNLSNSDERIIILNEPTYIPSPYNLDRAGIDTSFELYLPLIDKKIRTNRSEDYYKMSLEDKINRNIVNNPNFIKELDLFVEELMLKCEIRDEIREYISSDVILFCINFNPNFNYLKKEIELFLNQLCVICSKPLNKIRFIRIFFNEEPINILFKDFIKDLTTICNEHKGYKSGGCSNTRRSFKDLRCGFLCKKCYIKLFLNEEIIPKDL